MPTARLPSKPSAKSRTAAESSSVIVLGGSVKVGMWASLQGRDQGDGWLIAAVEFADNPSRHESHIGLVLTLTANLFR